MLGFVLLPYCILESGASVSVPMTGLRKAPIESVAHGGLRCLYSALPGGVPRPSLEDVLEFHDIVRRMFLQATLIPFRFPTKFLDEGGLLAFLREREAHFAEQLRKAGGLAQMELRLSPLAASARAAAPSGREYLEALRDRLQGCTRVAERAASTAREITRDWRRREDQGSLRCYVLLPRDAVADFRERMRRLPVDEGVALIVSGPWPPTEFMELELEAAGGQS